MPLKELLVIVCLVITAQAVAFTGSQLYRAYITSRPEGAAGHYLDENGVIQCGDRQLRYSSADARYVQVYLPIQQVNVEEQ